MNLSKFMSIVESHEGGKSFLFDPKMIEFLDKVLIEGDVYEWSVDPQTMTLSATRVARDPSILNKE